jgi:hypothetical protein
METNADAIHSERSSYREMLIEHLFAGELMRHFWRRESGLLEVAKPQVDDGGYDLVIESGGLIRHVQLKSSFLGSSLRAANIALALRRSPAVASWSFGFAGDAFTRAVPISGWRTGNAAT